MPLARNGRCRPCQWDISIWPCHQPSTLRLHYQAIPNTMGFGTPGQQAGPSHTDSVENLLEVKVQHQSLLAKQAAHLAKIDVDRKAMAKQQERIATLEEQGKMWSAWFSQVADVVLARKLVAPATGHERSAREHQGVHVQGEDGGRGLCRHRGKLRGSKELLERSGKPHPKDCGRLTAHEHRGHYQRGSPFRPCLVGVPCQRSTGLLGSVQDTGNRLHAGAAQHACSLNQRRLEAALQNHLCRGAWDAHARPNGLTLDSAGSAHVQPDLLLAVLRESCPRRLLEGDECLGQDRVNGHHGQESGDGLAAGTVHQGHQEQCCGHGQMHGARDKARSRRVLGGDPGNELGTKQNKSDEWKTDEWKTGEWTKGSGSTGQHK